MLRQLFSSALRGRPPICCGALWFSSTSAPPGSPADGAPQKVDTDVLIVGGGPVGLSLSILLSQLGVRSLVVEKRRQPTAHPQAHFINNRTMEIFRQMGDVAATIEREQPPLEEWRRFIYCHSMTGTLLGQVDHFAEQTGRPNLSPVSVAHFSQNKLVPLLLKTARANGREARASEQHLKGSGQGSEGLGQRSKGMGHGAGVSNMGSEGLGCILEGYTCSGFAASVGGVVSKLVPSLSTDPLDTTNELHQDPSKDQSLKDQLRPAPTPSLSVHSKFLIAADGASSGIRTQLGISLEGDGAIESLLSVHFECQGLHEKLAGRQAMLYFVFNEDVIMVVVAHDLRRGEFVAQIPFYPPQQKPEEFTPQLCREMIQKAIGDPSSPVLVRSIRPWTMTAQVAEKFGDKSGRVFLAGDAAHRFPPAGGFGMNTGIQDAHNLAWKLAAVVSGVSDASLLRTYEQERRPIAQANTALSVSNFKGAMAIPSALGLDPAAAKLLLRTLNRPPISLLPVSYQRELLERGLALGRAQMSPLLLNANNPVGRARLAEVSRIIRDGESLQLQFPAEDLGFRYTQGALWTGLPDVVERAESANAMGRKIGYEPDTRPGFRLPHCELAVGRVDIETGAVTATEDTISTLDLTNGGQLYLRLIVSADRQGASWEHALKDLQKILPFPFRGAVVWTHTSTTDAQEIRNQSTSERSSSLIDKEKNHSVLHLVDVRKSWAALPGVGPGVILLVRPDGHIAWRSKVEELRELADVNEGGVLQDIFSVQQH